MKVTPSEPIDVAIEVKKQSGSGMFKNQRLLLIKSGFISYFSQRPKYFVGNVRSLQLSGELPKMTLSATDIVAIERKVKYLHIKFNKKDLIDMEKLKKLVQGEKEEQKNNSNQMQEWIFKCENIQEAQMFIKQVLSYKNNPEFKPKIQNIIGGYKQGKKGFRPESFQMPAITPAHRFSQQPEVLVKKFRTNSVCEKTLTNQHNLFDLSSKITKQNGIIDQNAIQQENQQQIPHKISKDASSKNEPKEKSPLSKKNKEQINTYSKQTFPYYPFVKTRMNLKKQQLNDLNFGKNFRQDQSLLQKLTNNKIKNTKQQQTKKAKSSKVITPKRSLTVDNKKQVVQQRIQNPINSSSVNRSSSWSELKKLKRAYSLIGSLRKVSKDQQEISQQIQQKQEQYIQNNEQTLLSHQIWDEKQDNRPPQQSFLENNSMFVLNQKGSQKHEEQSSAIQVIEREINQKQNQKNDTEFSHDQFKGNQETKNQQSLIQQIKQNQEIEVTKKVPITLIQTKENKVLVNQNVKVEQNTLTTLNTPPSFLKEQKITSASIPVSTKQLQTQRQLQRKAQKQLQKKKEVSSLQINAVQLKIEMVVEQLAEELKKQQKQQIVVDSSKENQGMKQKLLKSQDKLTDKEQGKEKDKQIRFPEKQQEKIVENYESKQQIPQIAIYKQKEPKNIIKKTKGALNNFILSQGDVQPKKQIEANTKINAHIKKQVESEEQTKKQDITKKQMKENQNRPAIANNRQQIVSKIQQELKITNYTQGIVQEQSNEGDDEEQIDLNQAEQQILVKQQEIDKGSQHSQEDVEVNKIELTQILELGNSSQKGIEINFKKDEDAISFKNLQLTNQKKEVLMTPRFWQDEQKVFSIIENGRSEKDNLENRKAYERLIQSGLKQKQKIKGHQNEQIEKQAIAYSHHLLNINKNQQITQTFRKIANNFKSAQEEQFPPPIALELLAIRKQNLYQSNALNLMISFVDGHYCQEGVDCESIMFGKRIKCDGWCLYLCKDQQVYVKISQFYRRLSTQLSESSTKTIKFRASKVCGLKYKGYFGIFLQQPQLVHINTPKPVVTVVGKVAGNQIHEQIITQIRLGQDRQTNELIVYINPDYLENWHPNNHNKQWVSHGIGQQMIELGLDNIKNIVEYAWQEYVQYPGQSAEKIQKLETITKIFNSYFLTFMHTSKDQVQINQTCKLEEIASDTNKHQIDRLYNNLTANLSQSIFKSVKILYWKALKLLALSDLHQRHHVDICDYLSILSTAAQLYAQEEKYNLALQICTYNLEVLLGENSVQILTSSQFKLPQTKLHLMLNLSCNEEITKICQYLSINLILALECEIKTQKQQNTKVHELYWTIVSIIQEILTLSTNRINRCNGSIQKLAENNAYYSIILHQLFSHYLSQLVEVDQSRTQQICACKQKSYKYALFLLRLSGVDRTKIEVSRLVVINFIDFLIASNKYQEALSIAESEINQSQEKNNCNLYMTELNCRRDICLAYTVNSGHAKYQKFICYLQFYLQHITNDDNPSNLGRIKGIDSLTIIKTIIMTICSQFAYNNEQVFFEIRGIVKKIDLKNQVGEGIFEQSLGVLEPTIKKRISSKLYL